MHPTLHRILPKKLLSAVMYRVARIENPWLSSLLIRSFMSITGASLQDAQRQRINEYQSLLDFFTRELKPSARPIMGQPSDWISPADGRLAHIGDIDDGNIFQIKGHSYRLAELVTPTYADGFENGQAATIYLAPYDYHRIHLPCQAKLLSARYIPGELNSVSINLLNHIPGLFAKNERVVMAFSPKDNPEETFLMVLVGAVNVGSIETIFHGEITPNNYEEVLDLGGHSTYLDKGAEIGRFNLGSTVILIRANRQLHWQKSNDERCLLGECLAKPQQSDKPDKVDKSVPTTD